VESSAAVYPMILVGMLAGETQTFHPGAAFKGRLQAKKP